jgi:nucleoside-diphosphate kinase
MECNERVLSFVAEWFDPHPQIVKKYLLKYHLSTDEVEMKDIQTKRIFLRKTKLPPSLRESDFFIGAKILLLSRDLKVIEYADETTRSLLESVNEMTICVLSPAIYESIGDAMSLIELAGFTLVDLKSMRLRDVEDAYAAADLLRVDPNELLRPEPLAVMTFRGYNSVVAVHDVVKSSSLVDRGLFCPSNLDEAMMYTKFFMSRQSRTSATLDECTCCVIRPHAVRERIVGSILREITSRGFVISAAATFRLKRAAAAKFLEVYEGVVPEYREMLDEMCSGSVVALEVRLIESGGCDALDQQEKIVESFRAHAGPWDVNMGELNATNEEASVVSCHP